jgi:hypothetical protein
MVAGSAEKSDLKQLIEKFNINVNQDRIFIVDLRSITAPQ